MKIPTKVKRKMYLMLTTQGVAIEELTKITEETLPSDTFKTFSFWIEHYKQARIIIEWDKDGIPGSASIETWKEA